MVARGLFAFGKRLGSFATSSKPSQTGSYPSLCTAKGTSLTPLYGGHTLYGGYFLPYGRQWIYDIFL